MKTFVYPGSFDPIHNGHIDIIDRASSIFDRIIVLIANNETKQHLFTEEERFLLCKNVLKKFKNVKVDIVENNLLANYCKINNYSLMRSVRNHIDFEYESSMSTINYQLSKSNTETVFFFSSPRNKHISSTFIKEINSCNGDISLMVPYLVNKAINLKK